MKLRYACYRLRTLYGVPCLESRDGVPLLRRRRRAVAFLGEVLTRRWVVFAGGQIAKMRKNPFVPSLSEQRLLLLVTSM